MQIDNAGYKLSPAAWALQADRLKRSGDLIFQAYDKDVKALFKRGFVPTLKNLELGGVAVMLYGLAMENLIKSLLLLQGGSDDWYEKGHKQLALIDDLKGVDFSEAEKELLEKLTVFVVWAGRYKFPKKFKSGSSSQEFNKNNFPIPLHATWTRTQYL